MQEKHELILHKSTILLAEDEKNLRESFKKVLLLYVKDVFTAANGEEALSIYEEKHPDIIITDVKMPKVTGLEFIKTVRQYDHSTPIVVTSAYTDQNLLLESIKLSLIEYVVKPIKDSDLMSILENCASVLLENRRTIIKLTKDCTYDFDNKSLVCNKKQLPLTNKEVEFFELLLAHQGNLVTKTSIEDKLYIYEEAPPSALKNLVFKLRKKIPSDIIKTVGKLGYMIE